MSEVNAAACSDAATMSANIELRGVRVHNLKGIDVEIPLNRLTVVTGVSGSGKSSLAFDTLYAEGQRRYIESFSSSARRHLDRLEKPDADSILRILPAVALRQNAAAQSVSRHSTIATVTEIDDLLRILFARIGTFICPNCNLLVEQDSAAKITKWIGDLSHGRKVQIGFPFSGTTGRGECLADENDQADDLAELSRLFEDGFTRAVILERTTSVNSSVEVREETGCGRTVTLQNCLPPNGLLRNGPASEAIVIVDRLVAGKSSHERIVEAVETSLRESDGHCVLLVQALDPDLRSAEESDFETGAVRPFLSAIIDDSAWHVLNFSSRFDCSSCQRVFEKPEPSTLSFRSPLGACSACRGTGKVTTLNREILVPDDTISLRAGAVVPLAGDRWKRERERLLRFADAARIPLDVPFRDLTVTQKEQIYGECVLPDGSVPKTGEGLQGLLDRVEKRQQHTAIREFLGKCRQIVLCHSCQGTRLRPEALAVRIGNSIEHSPNVPAPSIGDISASTVDELLEFLPNISHRLSAEQLRIGSHVLNEVQDRLMFLNRAGLGYLSLNREITSLSRGEAQRVAMTSITSSRLVNTLFVIDEPSAGLHPRDVSQVVSIVKRLRDSSNTVVVVEHETEFLNAADHVVDIGPGAGQQGGQLVFSGSPNSLAGVQESATGQWLKGIAAQAGSETEMATERAGRSATGWLLLRGAVCHSVNDVSVDVPLGCLCVVTGVSGAGKSSLIEQTLVPAVCEKLGLPCQFDHAGTYRELKGTEHISSVELVDDRPLAGTRRSNPATWLKVFDEIRRLFADTEDARNRNLTASHFSFNTDSGGRCNKCEGTGRVEIDMQFLANVSMTCPECNGTRYQPHILEVQWRARTIADVLAMTSTEAFSFFRGQPKIQKRLRSLKDVGLDYLTLGQPLATLSGGESQRLKLAACLASSSRTGSLLIMNEPTTGLHPADVARLLECFDGLLSVGHSLVVIEHNLDVIRHADHIIDMGPEAGPGGGRIVATGSVADIAACSESITGCYLGKP
ncbi:MAG: excinuclease ABC subunit UvrA [Planctomycetota bacterium]|nr:excinuclease ABC subunit UvrA [Planctomycetota bacterium]